MKTRDLVLCLLLLLTLSTGLHALDVTVGAGNQQNRKPFDFFYRFSLFEAIYYPEEINTAGYIHSISYYNNFPNWNFANQHVQLWIGTTDLPDLSSGWVPSSQLQMLFNGTVNFPSGQNQITITLNHPFLYTGGNLVILTRSPGMTVTPVTPLNFYCQTIGTARARDFYSNSINPDPANPPMSGINLTLSGQFAKTTFHFNETPITYDLGITAFSGPQTMTLGNEYTHSVSVSNLGTTSQSDYTVKIYDWNHTELASATGVYLASGAGAEIPVVWTPGAAEGYSSVYAKVLSSNDMNRFNDTSQLMDVLFLPDDDGGITPPNPVTARIPIDFSRKNSLFETIFPASWLEYQNFNGNRQITGIKLYTAFAENLPAKPVKVWLGTTGLTDLTAGWITSGQMTAVYDGTIDFPIGNSSIDIAFQTPFFYTGGNLVMMVQRPMDDVFYGNGNLFTCYAGPAGITRMVSSHNLEYNPANPPAGTTSLTNQYPAVGFTFAFENLGSLNGIVSCSTGLPISGATVQLDYSNITATTDTRGAYSFGWLLPGTYMATVSAAGYVSQSRAVTVTGEANAVYNFTLHLATDLIVTGRVVTALNQEIGIADATVEITGAFTTAVSTDADGWFTIYDVIPNQTYLLRAMHPFYFTYYGEITVQSQNLDVGFLPLGIDTTPVEQPMAEVFTALKPNYPNPFSSYTTICFDIKEPALTTLEIYNIKGQKVRTLLSEMTKSGSYNLVWDARDTSGKRVSDGIYYFRMTSGRISQTHKMVLLK